MDNGGGGDLPEDVIPRVSTEAGANTSTAEGETASDILELHRILVQSLYGPAAKRAFRLKSKAFLLTFNSASFTDSKLLWETFLSWVEQRQADSQATYWSAAMERSLHSQQPGRVHLHVYFSWHGPGSQGVNQTTTDAWVFDGVRPRADVNTENRGAFRWLRAVQRGHFYCSVHKEGAVYTATNYPPWGGLWAPDASWVVGLWKQHKLGHDAFRQLSVKLRDGHDRRKACVDAVQIAESSAAFAEERAWARERLREKALPFKPLPWQIEAWMMRYEELEERYPMLVLYGPSQTGKSRLARSLFGVDRTLVVDVQNAQNPDLHAYRRGFHKAILLDEVMDPNFIVNNKKLLQAHVDGAILGQSATQMFTYEIFLWRTPIMLTTNKWDLSKFDQADLNWISANCVAVYVGEPVYETNSRKMSQPGRPNLRRQGPATTPGTSPPHKRFASSSVCPGCGDPLPCTCTVSIVLPELPFV